MSNRHSRREFLGLTAAGVAGALAPPWLRGAQAALTRGGSADGRRRPGRLQREGLHDGSAAAARRGVRDEGGRFVAVGSTADIKGLVGKGTQTFDAQADDDRARLHRLPQPRRRRRRCSTKCSSAIRSRSSSSRSTASSRSCARRRAKTPPGTWVDGYFFDDTKLKDKRALNVHDLDQVSTEHPVVVHHRGGHTSFYNSKALEMAGVTKNTPNPPGGTFDRDAERRAERPRDRSRAQRVRPRRRGARRSRRAASDSATATASRTSRSSSCATA